MSYRPPSRPPKGEWARFIHRMLKQADVSSSAAFEKLYGPLGLSPRSRQSWADIASGKRLPSEAEAEALATYFGGRPTDADREDTAPPDDLVSAMRAQTAAINDLVTLLRPVVEDQGTRLGEAEALLTRLSELVFSATPGQRAPRRTTG